MCMCVCGVCLVRKRKTSPSLTTSTGPTRKKRGKAAKSGTATPDGEEGSGSSNEDGGTSGTSGHLVAGRGMFSQYFNQPSTSSSSSGGGNNSRSSSTAARSAPPLPPASSPCVCVCGVCGVGVFHSFATCTHKHMQWTIISDQK